MIFSETISDIFLSLYSDYREIRSYHKCMVSFPFWLSEGKRKKLLPCNTFQKWEYICKLLFIKVKFESNGKCIRKSILQRKIIHLFLFLVYNSLTYYNLRLVHFPYDQDRSSKYWEIIFIHFCILNFKESSN